jgi:NAD+ dependent glucose-6-phosphate dehydrogenase
MATSDPSSSQTLPLVAVTGAAGRVGRLTARALAGRYRLRLIDLDWPDAVEEDPLDAAVDDAERVSSDLRDPEACAAAVESVDLLVHLAGQPSPQIGIREAIEDVAMPTANLVAAVPGSSVRRVVFASSIHTMGLYDRHGENPIDPTWTTRPCCEYGSAKVLSENLLRLLTERTDTSVVCLRLGLTGSLPPTGYAVSQWLGDDDFAALLRGALTASVTFGTYFGVSERARMRWDVTNGEADLGYVPTQVPPPPEDPDGEPDSGHCLMAPPL